MKLLPADILEVLKSSALPGTVFVEVDGFESVNKHLHKIVLAIVKRDEKWGNPTFVTLISYAENETVRWVINPWISEELIERMLKLPTPARAMARIPAELVMQLLEEVPSIDAKVEEVAEVVRKSVSKT